MGLLEARRLKDREFMVFLGEPAWVRQERQRRLAELQAGERFRQIVRRFLRWLAVIP